MARVRLGVVIVVPDPVAAEIDGLRRALGDPALDRIMPHVTVVPPVNVRVDDLDDAHAVLRAAAGAARPLDLRLGPPRTFGPGSPTLYLPVDAADVDLERLDRIRTAALVSPLERTVDHEFVPHVTVAAELPPDRLAAGIDALANFRGAFVADTLTLLRYVSAREAQPPGASERTDDPGPRGPHWEPIADVRLGAPAVVGRGSIEIELTLGSMLDAETLRLLDGLDQREDALDWFARPGVHGVPPGARVVVVTARRRGAVAGVGWGHTWSAGDPDRGPGGRRGAGPGWGRGEVAAIVVTPDAAFDGVERQIQLHLDAVITSA